MTRIILAASAIALLAACATQAPQPAGPDPKVAEAKGIIKDLFATLKGELETAMKNGGPTNAMTVCKGKAPVITSTTSTKTGWDVRRTSLKLRNAALNQPDPWERKVLEQFDARKAKGEDLANMDYSEVVDQGGQQTFRYMKAIPMLDLCLTCHGTAIKPEVKASLAKLYPGDQAVGYKEGDLRGAFSLKKKL